MVLVRQCGLQIAVTGLLLFQPRKHRLPIIPILVVALPVVFAPLITPMIATVHKDLLAIPFSITIIVVLEANMLPHIFRQRIMHLDILISILVLNLKQFVQIAAPAIHLFTVGITFPIAAVKTTITGLTMEPVPAMHRHTMFLLTIIPVLITATSS
jgi:hypothetical protein